MKWTAVLTCNHYYGAVCDTVQSVNDEIQHLFYVVYRSDLYIIYTVKSVFISPQIEGKTPITITYFDILSGVSVVHNTEV